MDGGVKLDVTVPGAGSVVECSWVVVDDECDEDDGVEEKAFAPDERAKIVARTEDF